MYSIARSPRSMQSRSKVILKYACYSYRSSRNQSKYSKAGHPCLSSSPMCTNHTSHSVLSTARYALASNCDPLSYRYDCDFRSIYPLYNTIGSDRYLHTSSVLLADSSKSSSKVEETVKALKEKATAVGESKPAEVEVKKTLQQKIWDECVHYYHGFRLLFIDIKVSSKLVLRILNGQQLTRREHNLLVRTVSDLFRLVPFSVFLIIPFTELLLPVIARFFPGMLPSTFMTAKDKDDRAKKSLKVKLEMAKFLQETLDNMTLKGSGHSSKAAKDFAEFCEKVRSEGGLCTSEEIMKFSKLFEDEITLDSLPRPQLMALCRVLELKPIGTSNFLRFQLRMKLRSLAADDVMIQKEGIESLLLSELQQACRARGMRAYGLSAERLRFQLEQWLDLSLNKKVPPSLLLLSRAFMLPETIPTTDKLKATISALPETVAVSTKAAIGEREGKVDHKTKIEIIKEEERKIQEERNEIDEEVRLAKEAEAERLKSKAEMLVDQASELVDKATELEPQAMSAQAMQTQRTIAAVRKKLEDEAVTSEHIQTLQDAMEALTTEKKSYRLEKEELEELKEEMAEYKEDVDDLKEVMEASEDAKATKLKESKAAQRLYKKVSSMIQTMDEVVAKLETKEKDMAKSMDEKQMAENEELFRIDELIGAIRKIQKIPDEAKVKKIAEVLSHIDEDHDGAIRIDTVLKVLEEIDEGNMKLSPKQIAEMVDLLEKEAAIEVEEKLEKEGAGNQSTSSAAAKSKTPEQSKNPILSEAGTTLPPTNGDVAKPTPKSKTL